MERFKGSRENFIRKPYSTTKSLVPLTILVRVRVRVLESSGRNKRFSGRIIGTQF